MVDSRQEKINQDIRSILAKFVPPQGCLVGAKSLSMQRVAALCHSTSQDLGEKRSKALAKLGYCNIEVIPFSRQGEKQIVLAGKWAENPRSAYDDWCAKLSASIEPEPQVQPKSSQLDRSILDLVLSLGEAAIGVIHYRLKQQDASLTISKVQQTLDRLVVSSQLTLIDRAKTTFYMVPEPKPGRKKNRTTETVDSLKQKIKLLTEKRGKLLARAAEIEDEILQLNYRAHILQEAEEARKKQLKQLRKEAKQYGNDRRSA